MMSDETRQERVRRLKKERSQKEMEYDLSCDLKLKEDKREIEQNEQQHRNKYVDKAILFFCTLAVCYLAFFILSFLFNYLFGAALAMLGVSLAFIHPFIHAAIWIGAILSAYRNRSVLDDITQRFF